MDIGEIRAKVRANQYVYTLHADIERKADGLTLAQVEEALWDSQARFLSISSAAGAVTAWRSSRCISRARPGLLIRGHEGEGNESDQMQFLRKRPV